MVSGGIMKLVVACNGQGLPSMGSGRTCRVLCLEHCTDHPKKTTNVRMYVVNHPWFYLGSFAQVLRCLLMLALCA